MQPSQSTGPRTDAGKRRSSINAVKHGLTGHSIVLSDVEQDAYRDHCQGFVDLYKPVGAAEKALTQCLADDHWRALKGRVLEGNQLQAMLYNGPGSAILTIKLEQEKMLANLALYLNRIERSIKNNTKSLEEMQAARKAAREQAEQQVKALARAAAANGETYDPARDFPSGGKFVFSKSQVADLLSREDRLKPAADTSFVSQMSQRAFEKLAKNLFQAA